MSSTTSREKAQPFIENLKHLVGGVPSIIEKNIKFLEVVDEKNIVCKPCGYNLEIFDDQVKTTKYFTDHFSDDVHTSNVRNTYMFFYNKYTKLIPTREIPQVILNNLEHLAVSGESVNCKICDKKKVAVFSKMPRSKWFKCEEDISKHFLTNEHQEEVKKWNDKTNLVRVKLEEKYGVFPTSLVLNGVEDHLGKSREDDGLYCCTLCNVSFINNNELKGDLETHFQSDEHTNKVEDHKVMTKIPVFRNIYSNPIDNCEQPFFLPHFIVKNIEYIECNSTLLRSFFCCVCAEDIVTDFRRDETFLTRQVLKSHLTSSNHLDNLCKWRNPQNKEYKRLIELFATFPNSVLNQLSYIGIKGEHFYCHLCKCLIIDKNDSHYTVKNILAHLLPGYNDLFGIGVNSVHEENLNLKGNMYETVKKEIMREKEKKPNFKGMSEIISKNIPFLKDAGNSFLECVICEAKMKLFENDPVRTNTTFEQHLGKSRHTGNLQNLSEQKKHVIHVLEPYTNQLIKDNLHHIEFKDTSDKVSKYRIRVDYDDNYDSSDDEFMNQQMPETTNANNFYCSPCNKVIIAGKPDKYEVDEDKENDLAKRVSQYNLTTHFSSGQHRSSVKDLSSRVQRAKQMLNGVFGNIPNYVWANICHMSKDDHRPTRCTLCDEYIPLRTVERITEEHFLYDVQATAKHAKRINKLEIKNRLAMNIFKKRFWQVPEFVVKNIGVLRISGDNLFCILCQETIYVDAYDLEVTEAAFYIHLNSGKHVCNVNGTLADWAKLQFNVR